MHPSRRKPSPDLPQTDGTTTAQRNAGELTKEASASRREVRTPTALDSLSNQEMSCRTYAHEERRRKGRTSKVVAIEVEALLVANKDVHDRAEW